MAWEEPKTTASFTRSGSAKRDLDEFVVVSCALAELTSSDGKRKTSRKTDVERSRSARLCTKPPTWMLRSAPF